MYLKAHPIFYIVVLWVGGWSASDLALNAIQAYTKTQYLHAI